jgi:small subunit ribosomal protein S5
MADEQKIIEQKIDTPAVTTAVVADATAPDASVSIPGQPKPVRRANQDRDRNPRRNPRRSRNDAKARPEFDQKIIDIRRVARVVSGGRRFSFSVAIVIGDGKGSVGVGLGKGGDTALAIEKALRNARKNMIKIPTTKSMSIPYETSAKYSASRVTIKPIPGRGLVAGSSVRSVLELAGLKDVGAKIQSPSKNRLNNARVAIEALRTLTPHRKTIAAMRPSMAAKEPVAAK